MYTKSNRKSGSANSLAWFPPYFCFRFRLQGLPNAIFRRIWTFRRRLARLVPQPMLGVPFLGTLPVGVTSPHDSDHAECEGVSNTTPCSRMFTLLYSGYLPPYIFENFSSYKIAIFLKFCMSLGVEALTNICRNCDFLRVRF